MMFLRRSLTSLQRWSVISVKFFILHVFTERRSVPFSNFESTQANYICCFSRVWVWNGTKARACQWWISWIELESSRARPWVLSSVPCSKVGWKLLFRKAPSLNAYAILFFFSVYRRPTDQIFGIFQKKIKSNDVDKPFLTWNNS